MKKGIVIALSILVVLLSAVIVYSEVSNINLISPSNNKYTNNSTPDFVFNVTSNSSENISCELFINETGYGLNGSVVNSTEVTITANDSLIEGRYYWQINCTDDEATSESEQRNLVIDFTAPTSSDNSTNSTYAGQVVKHYLRWGDTYSLSGYIFSFDDGNTTFVNNSFAVFSGTTNWSNVTKTVNSTVGATIKWKVYANDSAGNWNISEEFEYITEDGTAPTASFGTNPVSAYNDSDGSIVFDFKCSDNVNVTGIQLWTNTTGTWHANYTNISYTNNTWLNVTVTGINEKQNYKWAVYCNDSSDLGDWTDTNRTFNVDETSPEITNTYPANGVTYTLSSGGTKTVTFTYRVTDNIGIRNCSLYIDGDREESDTSVSNNTNQTLSYTFEDDADYDWKISCSDYASRVDNSTTRTLTIDPYSGGNSGGGDDDDDTDTNQSIGAVTSSKAVVNLPKGSKVTFRVNGTTHTITVKNISSYSSFLELASTPIIFSINVGEIKFFDLNNNTKSDFSINLTGVSSSKVNFTIVVIPEIVVNQTVNQTTNQTLNATGNFTSNNSTIRIAPESWKWIALVLVIIVVAFGVATIILIQNRKKKTWWKKGH